MILGETPTPPPLPGDPLHAPGGGDPQLPRSPAEDPNQVPSGVPAPRQEPDVPDPVPQTEPAIQPVPF